MSEIIMSSDTLDDKSVVVNFDVIDAMGKVSVTGGYIQVRHEDGLVTVTVFNNAGIVLNEKSYLEEEFIQEEYVS